MSCWSSVTYFFSCVCVYLFFREKERREKIGRIFDDRGVCVTTNIRQIVRICEKKERKREYLRGKYFSI